MITKGIRGAITVDGNTKEDLKSATLLLLDELLKQNGISKDDISHVIFTVTNDIDAAFPATFARTELGWNDVAMLCFNEIPVDGALKMCLRVLVVVNCEPEFTPQYVYLKGAKALRA